MKLFTGPRQTGNTLRMIEHSERMLTEATLNWDKQNGDWKVLIVTRKHDTSIKLMHEFIDHLKSKGIDTPEFNNICKDITIPVRSDMNVIISARTSKDVTLDDMKDYDTVIVDDVFEAHPYREQILIRATVE